MPMVMIISGGREDVVTLPGVIPAQVTPAWVMTLARPPGTLTTGLTCAAAMALTPWG
jgi:hypothetical protein